MVIQVLNSQLGITLHVSVTSAISHYSVIKTMFMYFCVWLVFLAVRMVADVIETRNVIFSFEFKTCMTI